jgi:hypothetical protein
MKRLIACTIAAALCTFAASSFADETAATAAAVSAPGASASGDDYLTSDTSDGYSVVFVDDLLNGGGIDGSTPLIKVRPPAARSTLIQPRLQFVPELLKSVEGL